MTQYEVTFIVDPVLSGDGVKETVKTYQDMLSEKGGEIVHVDEIGLRSLAYEINKRTTGVYYCIEFKAPGVVIDDLELALRRDERIIRFLTVKLDKYGVKYNADKRAGLIGRKKDKVSEEISSAKAEDAKPDDLTKVEGIGPKINGLLQDAGIRTFRQLAEAGVGRIKDVLIEAGGSYKSKDPGTWPNQAELAANGKWDELKELQDRLNGGKEA